ncbi:MAG TPA: putative glycoside hydrolase [Sporichthyaceae bacterium]|jgi:hypothetical protein|nr:putative glycoside hydrolase [Sporichthyaceae bacterium]
MTAFDAGPPGARGGEPGATPAQSGSTKRKTGRNTAVVGGVALLLIVVGAAASPLASGPSIKIAASSDLSAPLNGDTVKNLSFTVTGGNLSKLTMTMDGKKVDGTTSGNSTVYTPSGLSDGKHSFTATEPGHFGRTSSTSDSFTINSAGAAGNSAAPAAPATASPAPGATKTMFGLRAVHMTASAWAYKPLHDPVVQMLKDHKIDTIEMDIKDEDGHVQYKSNVPLAQQDGAENTTLYDPAAMLKEIHDLGGKVVGRIVAFKDPLLAKYAFANGHPSWGVQDKNGNAYHAGSYGTAAFTNLASPEVQQYNADLAVEATKLGFDAIMFDYIRRPEGPIGSEVYPGIGNQQAQDVIANYLGTVEPAVHAAGGLLGAAVFGISAFTAAGAGDVAQNIPAMSKNLDFIAPMDYPSHWGKGEYGVAVPWNSPYDIMYRSLMDFNRQAAEGNAVIIPWIQDFNFPGQPAWTPEDVQAQIKAAHDDGINSFFVWNAFAKYQYDAYTPNSANPQNDAPGTLRYSIDKPGVNSVGTTDKAQALTSFDAYIAAKAAGASSSGSGTGSSSSGSSTSTASPSATPASKN